MTDFLSEIKYRISNMRKNNNLTKASNVFMEESIKAMYSYNWLWLGRPIIQYPQDICAMQELVWRIQPDVIVETGIAHGGSLILSASLLSLIDLCEATSHGDIIDTKNPKRRVVGVDIDIRPHNKSAIEEHPLANRINMIQGSSIDSNIIQQVKDTVGDAKNVLVCLDSNHTHNHVLAELFAYSPLVSLNSYCIVFDTVIENLPASMYEDRPWDVGDNAMTAVAEFLAINSNFEIDEQLDTKLQISVAPKGYLKRIL